MNTTTISSAVAAPAPAKQKRTRGPLNQDQMRRLNKAEDIARAAQKEDHASLLAARDITAEYLTDLVDDIAEARTKAALAVQHSTAAKKSTADDYKAAHDLIAALQEVQKAAKQKYARTNRIVLADYFVGKKLNGNRPNLMQTSQTIVTRLGEDTLPGITTAKVTKLKNLRAAWIAANQSQGESASAAQLVRAELRGMLKTISDRKAAVQLAADAQWPHSDESNAAVRREFGLSPRMPFLA